MPLFNSLKSRFFGMFKVKIPSQCSRTPLLSVTSRDCDIILRMFSYEHSNHIFVTSQLEGLKLCVLASM